MDEARGAKLEAVDAALEDDEEYQGRKTSWVNVGSPIGAILAHLKERHAALWEEIRQVQSLPD